LKEGDFPENCMKTFDFLKNSLVSKSIVDYPRKNRTYSLTVDASTGTSEINGV
jgi:hypothetical protein